MTEGEASAAQNVRVVRAPRALRRFRTVIAVILLAMWTSAAYLPLHASVVEIAMFVVWLSGMLFLVLLLAWTLAGRQILTIANGDLNVEWRLGSIRVTEVAAYAIDSLRSVRVETRKRRVKGAPSVSYFVVIDTAHGSADVAHCKSPVDASGVCEWLSSAAANVL